MLYNSQIAATPTDASPLRDAGVVDMPGNLEPSRQITYVELDESAPFPVQRIYWIHSLTAGEIRGMHAHKTTRQLLIATSGAFHVLLDDGQDQHEFMLDRPTEALFVPAGLWRTIRTITSGSVMLVLASSHFSEADYIRDYGDYQAFALDRGLSAPG